MSAHIRTTLDSASALLKKAKAVARCKSETIRELIERGLQLVFPELRGRPSFKLRDASVGGKGLHPDAAERPWDELCARSYEGRGG